MSYDEVVSRLSQSLNSELSAFDRQSLTYTSGYVRDYTKKMSWSDAYELFDRLLLVKWKYDNSFAIDAPVIDGFGRILSDNDLEKYYLYRDSASLLTENS